MLKHINCFALLFLLNTCCFSQHVFNKNYPFTYSARANTVITTSDSGFVIAGTNTNLGIMSAIKVNKVGDTLWSHVIELGVNSGNQIQSIIETHNGNYVTAGSSGDQILHRSHAVLIKFSTNGDTLWTRKLGLPNLSERFYGIKQTADDGFIICGIRIGATTYEDVYLVKTDSMGIPQWERTYGGNNSDFALSLELTQEGGFMILGYTYSYGIGQYNMYLIKTDSLGNMLWQKTYGGPLKDYGQSITKTTDGNYVIVGGIYVSTDTVAAYAAKIDTAGNVLWEKTYRGNYKYAGFNAVKTLPNGNYAISGGLVTRPGNIRNYGQLNILDQTNGNILWRKEYKHYDADSVQQEFYAMDICQDGGFAMAGMISDLRAGANPYNSMWLVKTDCMGNDSIWDSAACPLTVGVEELKMENGELRIYPNPAHSELRIMNEGLRMEEVKIYNVLGECVFNLSIKQLDNVTIDVSSLLSGIYILEATTTKGAMRKKFVKE
jgi:Secretion system C-terminal sorting domain